MFRLSEKFKQIKCFFKFSVKLGLNFTDLGDVKGYGSRKFIFSVNGYSGKCII